MKSRLHLPPTTCRLAVFAALLQLILDGAALANGLSVGPNVNTSRLGGNQAEAAVALDPTNPDRLFVASNMDRSIDGLFAAYSTDGGATWNYTRPGGLIADGSDGFPRACCDASLGATCDAFGNIFLVYLTLSPTRGIVILVSTNGGAGFRLVTTLASGRPTDQPTITTGCSGATNATVWVTYTDGGSGTDLIVAQGARVTGLGAVSAFSAAQAVPGSADGNYGDIVIGPAGQVLVTYMTPSDGQGPGSIWVSLDHDGLGPAGFGNPVLVTATGVGGFDFIPAQSGRSVDAEPGLVFDTRVGSPFFGRAYLMYNDEQPDESNNLDIWLRHSDDNGATWSAPLRVNDDNTTRSQFLPRMTFDPVSGALAFAWHDCRDDAGSGPGDTDGIPNDEARMYGTVSFDGGLTFCPNVPISTGSSRAAVAASGVDYGDYTGLAFHAGRFYPVWADNSNSTGDNPNGTRSKFDIYMARVTVGNTPLVTVSNVTLAAESCPNSAADPGEALLIAVNLQNTGNAAATNLVATLLAGNGVRTPGTPQNFGTLAAGGVATRTFSLMATGTCGGRLVLRFQLQAGASDLGTVDFPLALGRVILLTNVFVNPAGMAIPAQGAAATYPSIINVAGLSGLVQKVTVTLSNLSHGFPRDLDIAVQGPTGAAVWLMSDAGGADIMSARTLVFDDAASALLLPDVTPTNGTYRPVNNDPADLLPTPAPSSGLDTLLSAFANTSPNGPWKLFIFDDFEPDGGQLAGGWSLRLITVTTECCTAPPALHLTLQGTNVALAWPAGAMGFNLETTANLNPPAVWSPVKAPITEVGGEKRVLFPLGPGNRFFQLRWQP